MHLLTPELRPLPGCEHLAAHRYARGEHPARAYLRGLSPGASRRTARTVLRGLAHLASGGETARSGEVGGDAKLTLNSLTLDVTVNTDFAQVEVDEQRTNLTRFPLFFPEKRPFFLENAGVFSAGTPQAADLFFSRRIGISPLGNPVPILGGARVTGKTAGLNVGFLQIFTDQLGTEASENAFSVARVSRELPSRSRVAAIFVQRRATYDGTDFNRFP